MGLALAKEIIAALFQHAPHRGVGVNNGRAATDRPTTTAVPRPEYACSQCGSMNWCDRTTCRHCKQPRPAGWSPGAGPAGRASGLRAKVSARPGTSIASPGQQAEALRQAAAAAKRAGATPDALRLLAEAERAARMRQAAAKSSKPVDMARAAVDQAATAVSAADAAVAAAEAALAAARQKADAARARHRDKITELDRIASIASSSPMAPVVLQQTSAELLSKAQCVTSSLDRFLSAAASGTIPDAFRKEVADLKLAMSIAQQAQQASLTATVAATHPPVNRDAPTEAFLAGAKQLLTILENGRVLNAGIRGRDLPDDLVDSMAKVHQAVLSIEPVGLPDLNDALEPAARDIACEVLENENMGTEEDLHARASTILEQIQNGTAEAALGFVRDHLVAVANKGNGKGANRFAPS